MEEGDLKDDAGHGVSCNMAVCDLTETRLTVMKCCAIKSDVKIDLFLVINHSSGHFRQ
jgi:hypothetical protein